MLVNLGNALCANAEDEEALETYREANRLDANAVPLPVRLRLMEADPGWEMSFAQHWMLSDCCNSWALV